MGRQRDKHNRRLRLAQERKAAKHAGEVAANSPPPAEAAPDTGGGGGSLLRPLQENKLIGLMVHADRAAWPIDESLELHAVEVTRRHMGSDDPKVANSAVRNLVAMKGQILKQISDKLPKAVNATQVNVNAEPTGIVIEFHELPPREEVVEDDG